MTAGKLLHTYNHESQPVSLSFSPMEFLMSVTTSRGGIYLYDLTNFESITSYTNNDQPILASDFDPNGESIFALYADKLDIFSLEPLQRVESIPMKWGNVKDFFIYPAEKKLVAASVDQHYLSFWGMNLKKKSENKNMASTESLKLPQIASIQSIEKGVSNVSLSNSSMQSSRSSESVNRVQDLINTNTESPYLKEKRKDSTVSLTTASVTEEMVTVGKSIFLF